MRKRKPEYVRIQEVAERLLKPSWVKRFHMGDEQAAAAALAEKYDFRGRIEYMRKLCELFVAHPERTHFEQAVLDFHAIGKRMSVSRLAHCEITDDPTLKPREELGASTVGDCYRQAYYFVVDDAPDGSHLVHGHIKAGADSTQLIGHAWVELPGGIVYDGVLQRFYRLDGYYTSREAKWTLAFPKSDVPMILAGKFHFGPWD